MTVLNIQHSLLNELITLVCELLKHDLLVIISLHCYSFYLISAGNFAGAHVRSLFQSFGSSEEGDENSTVT